MISKYFSGQGILYLAKYDNEGKLGKFIDLGNVSRLAISEDKCHFRIEHISKDTLQLVFGTYIGADDGTKLPTVKTGTEEYELFEISPTTSDIVYLVFEGINTADWNERFRIDLPKVALKKPTYIELLNNTFTSFDITGNITDWKGAYISGKKNLFSDRVVPALDTSIIKTTLGYRLKKWFRKYFVPKKKFNKTPSSGQMITLRFTFDDLFKHRELEDAIVKAIVNNKHILK